MKILFISILILDILILIMAELENNDDYCNATWTCPNHIGCNNDGEIAEACNHKAEIIDLYITGIRNIFVDLHNILRNDLSLGNIPNFKMASRMATIEWDDELAELAELNVKTCEFKPDECRNIERFISSGQNLAYWAGYPITTPQDIVRRTIKKWFGQHRFCNMSVINKFPMTKPECGSFTLMVNEKNIRFGCAVLQQFDIPFDSYTITCNYSIDNIRNLIIYDSGRYPAINCLTGVNRDYNGLCSELEPIDPNEMEFNENDIIEEEFDMDDEENMDDEDNMDD